MLIQRCPICGTKNRILPHDSKLRPVCGKCGAPLNDNFDISPTLNANCVICGSNYGATEVLLNNAVYHKPCYEKLKNDIEKTDLEIKRKEDKINQLESEIDKASKLIYKIMTSFRKRTDLEFIKREIELTKNNINKLLNKDKKLKEILFNLYTFWPTYPPDWDDRRARILSKTQYCEQCGEAYTKLHIHHRIPLSKGGNHAIDNLMLLCEDCHSKIHGGLEFSYTNNQEIGTFVKRLKLIRKAINEHNIIHFQYRKYNGEKSVRSIIPKGLKMIKKSLCVYGYCYLRNDLRIFAIKRMRAVKIVSEPGQCYEI